MRDKLYYAGRNLEDFGAVILRRRVDSTPERAYTDVTVKGRHGTVLEDDRRLSNVKVSYGILFMSDGGDSFNRLKNWLLSVSGYQRIEDTCDTECFRLGVYRGATEPELDWRRSWTKCELEFDCLPQRWLKEGETEKTITSGDKLVNPCLTQAKPLITVRGTGTLTVAGTQITISSQSTAGYITIDCEEEDARAGSENCNSKITLPGNTFPVLGPGENTVTFSGLTSVKITPRWWKI